MFLILSGTIKSSIAHFPKNRKLLPMQMGKTPKISALFPKSSFLERFVFSCLLNQMEKYSLYLFFKKMPSLRDRREGIS